MKVSVSIPEQDLRFLDDYVVDNGLGSRSAGVHEAIGALRQMALTLEAEQAISEWYDSGEAEVWDVTVADGLESDVSR
jgi:Arc/MetJ-type ribon-helix-helix transcriptional regulator